MKNICISTDSRGGFPGYKTTWCIILEEKLPIYNIMYSKKHYVFFSTLWDHLLALKQINNIFDIGIIQLGYHDYVVPWTLPVWKSLELPEEDLNKYLVKFPDQTIANHAFKNCYHYKNDDAIIKLFEEFRKYMKKIIFIEMPYSWKELEEKTLYMNALYSKCSDETITMPREKDFPVKYTLNLPGDRVHYTDEYHQILADKVIEKINILI